MPERAWHLQRLLRAERWSPARLAAIQSRKLERLLRHASSHVPFYRERHAAALAATRGLSPLEQLRELPVIDKVELRAAGEAAWNGPAHPEDKWIRTSGSTGEPYRFPIDRTYDRLRKAQYLRPYLANGRRLRDSVLRVTAFPRSPPWFARLGLLRERQLGCDLPPDAMLAALRETQPTILQGYPSGLRLLAQHLRATGEAAPPLRRVFTDSELLTSDTRALLADVFDAPVVDIFGSFETDNIGYECAAGHGHHITTDTVIVELLRDGVPVPPGEQGELVVTVLDNMRSPFIRYRLRDLASWIPGPCPCGRTFPLLRLGSGRADDLLRLPDGAFRDPMRIVVGLYDLTDALVHYQLRQAASGACELLYVPAQPRRPDLEARLLATVTPHLGGCPLRLREVPSIPLTRAGKLRAFVRAATDEG